MFLGTSSRAVLAVVVPLPQSRQKLLRSCDTKSAAIRSECVWKNKLCQRKARPRVQSREATDAKIQNHGEHFFTDAIKPSGLTKARQMLQLIAYKKCY